MSKYIDSEKLLAEIKRRVVEDYNGPDSEQNETAQGAILGLMPFIASLQQEQPEVPDAKSKGGLEYWLEFFGMPTENIENCATQIAQDYGACRYLEGVRHGAEAVNELGKEVAREEQPEVDLEEELENFARQYPMEHSGSYRNLMTLARHFYELGKIARKEK